MFCIHELTPGQQDDMDNLLLELPYEFFRGEPRLVEEDRALVAESIITGQRLLISENRSSIRQLGLNRWLQETQWIKAEQWIRPTAEVLGAVEPVTCDDVIYIWALRAFLLNNSSHRDADTVMEAAHAEGYTPPLSM